MKKDLVLVLVVAALGVTGFVVTADRSPVAARPHDPYHPGAHDATLLKYKAEGGFGSIVFFEATVRGPGECAVRYQTRGGPVVERKRALSEEDFRDLLERLARVDFFEVEEVPRSGYLADMATVTVALSIGEQRNEVTVDARRRSSRDLSPVTAFFDAIRKAITPEPVSTGD